MCHCLETNKQTNKHDPTNQNDDALLSVNNAKIPIESILIGLREVFRRFSPVTRFALICCRYPHNDLYQPIPAHATLRTPCYLVKWMLWRSLWYCFFMPPKLVNWVHVCVFTQKSGYFDILQRWNHNCRVTLRLRPRKKIWPTLNIFPNPQAVDTSAHHILAQFCANTEVIEMCLLTCNEITSDFNILLTRHEDQNIT